MFMKTNFSDMKANGKMMWGMDTEHTQMQMDEFYKRVFGGMAILLNKYFLNLSFKETNPFLNMSTWMCRIEFKVFKFFRHFYLVPNATINFFKGHKPDLNTSKLQILTFKKNHLLHFVPGINVKRNFFPGIKYGAFR